MSQLDDQFDLDIRITPLGDPRTDDPRLIAGTDGWECYSVNPSCGDTCGCSTVETCNQQLEDCGFPFTFPGNYCEDQSDGCGDPGPDLIPMSMTAKLVPASARRRPTVTDHCCRHRTAVEPTCS